MQHSAIMRAGAALRNAELRGRGKQAAVSRGRFAEL
jgi:hypothetical protein